MYYVEVLLHKDGINKLVSKQIYKNFRKAFSDIIDGTLNFGFDRAEIKALDIEWEKPTVIGASGEDKDGYLDDFNFKYGDVLTVVLGQCFIVDEERYEDE